MRSCRRRMTHESCCGGVAELRSCGRCGRCGRCGVAGVAELRSCGRCGATDVAELRTLRSQNNNPSIETTDERRSLLCLLPLHRVTRYASFFFQPPMHADKQRLESRLRSSVVPARLTLHIAQFTSTGSPLPVHTFQKGGRMNLPHCPLMRLTF